jgi:DNA-binding NarL/FixJ family response regulator
VIVLDLQRAHPGIDLRLLGALSARESEVATHVAEGLTDRDIAEALYLSRFTVQQHVKSIYRTLGVRLPGRAGALLSRRAAGLAARSIPKIRD